MTIPVSTRPHLPIAEVPSSYKGRRHLGIRNHKCNVSAFLSIIWRTIGLSRSRLDGVKPFFSNVCYRCTSSQHGSYLGPHRSFIPVRLDRFEVSRAFQTVTGSAIHPTSFRSSLRESRLFYNRRIPVKTSLTRSTFPFYNLIQRDRTDNRYIVTRYTPFERRWAPFRGGPRLLTHTCEDSRPAELRYYTVYRVSEASICWTCPVEGG